ncbi:MAG: cytochrome c [Bryobacterales bacterium]|nr:cytochrome c [Bryobacterales bacterium]
MSGKYLILLVVTPGLLPAHDPITTKVTFSREIIRLFQKRCLTCHQDGGKAPMSLAAYSEARPWAKAIKEEVLERRMPPWGAVKGFGAFKHDQALTQEEVSLIADWVEGGAPEGDPKYLPSTPIPNPPAIFKPSASRLTVLKSQVLTKPRTLLAIAPQPGKPISSARITAELPDGSVEPLLWLKDYKPAWKHTFELRKPLTLPAGTRILVDPEAAVTLYFSR